MSLPSELIALDEALAELATKDRRKAERRQTALLRRPEPSNRPPMLWASRPARLIAIGPMPGLGSTARCWATAIY